MMVSGQFDVKGNVNAEVDQQGNPVNDDIVENFSDDPTLEQLQQAADELNSADDMPPPDSRDQVIERPLPPSVLNRKEITDRQAAARKNDMVEGQGLGPSDDVQAEELNLNAQNIHYGDFGSKDKNFMG
ncbi:MAG: hypothetical protein GY938_30980, partial [Ketobacter sp.]|nr:hypothetical protein [Ketobacter sp.]